MAETQMKLSIQPTDLSIRPVTRALMQRLVSPLCGLDQRISFMTRGPFDPRFMTAGAQLTGVHVLQNRPQPKFTAYHIGGGGIFLDEPLIRTLGETIERYSQLVSEVSLGRYLVFTSYEEMLARGELILKPENFRFFTDEQYSTPKMPFQRFSPGAPMAWLKAPTLTQSSHLWVPAQLVLVGYGPRTDAGELWLSAAITTGTASHTLPERALKGALLELIQIDAAMGHWYSNASASEVILDRRVAGLEQILQKYFPARGVKAKFYWLPNADLPGLPIACVVRSPGILPVLGVGLGCDLNLKQAMYKSLLEAVSVRQLAKISLLYQSPEEAAQKSGPMMDFDSNVAYYARPGNQEMIDAKFGQGSSIRATDLPADARSSVPEQNSMLVDAFRRTNKQLLALDLTTDDVRALGFRTFRVWSPDTISLCLPSFPTRAQARFASYGGAQHAKPHPYA
jgi:thiazole/oxazole-forming peptide maturase SagD family component